MNDKAYRIIGWSIIAIVAVAAFGLFIRGEVFRQHLVDAQEANRQLESRIGELAGYHQQLEAIQRAASEIHTGLAAANASDADDIDEAERSIRRISAIIDGYYRLIAAIEQGVP